MTEHKTEDAPKPSVPSLKVAILSDLHAFDGSIDEFKREQPSYWDVSRPARSPKENPVLGVLDLIAQKELSASLLLCAGDMTTKSHPAALQQAWTRLQAIGEALHVESIVAVPGNHDYDSRSLYCDYDPKLQLQALAPPFPLGDSTQNHLFWSRHWVSVRSGAWRVVLINSSAYEGIRDEFMWGRVNAGTIYDVGKELKDPCSLNIVLCHHHPLAQSSALHNTNSAMIGGDELFATLEEADGKSFVVHGHRHHPRLFYAPGGSSSSVVLSAGSLCARRDGVSGGLARNQFYMVEFHLDDFGSYGCVGEFEAWDWHYARGFQPATDDLPAAGGFGFRGDIDALAADLARQLTPLINERRELLLQMPQLRYLIPSDAVRFKKTMESKHGWEVLLTAGQVMQVNSRRRQA